VRGLIASVSRGILPATPNVYKTKKDAQDAHEAIRPTSVLHTPDDIAKYLSEDELRLYRIIWMRFVASQMTPAVFDQTTIEVTARGRDGPIICCARPGRCPVRRLLAVYEEGKDQKDAEDDS